MSRIASLTQAFAQDFGLTPRMACEVEFYLPGVTDEAAMLAALDTLVVSLAIEAMPAKRERGDGQYEIALFDIADPERHAHDIALLRRVLEAELHADFRPVPFPDDAGSALHMHLSLHDGAGENAFTRAGDEWDAPYSEPLLHVLGGLLATLPQNMPVFAPSEASRARFVPGRHAPTTVSWGPNNRTTALRLPPKPLHDKHIEHRVPCADADPEAVVIAILEGAHTGLAQRLDPGPAIHGDASDAQYGLPKLFDS